MKFEFRWTKETNFLRWWVSRANSFHSVSDAICFQLIANCESAVKVRSSYNLFCLKFFWVSFGTQIWIRDRARFPFVKDQFSLKFAEPINKIWISLNKRNQFSPQMSQSTAKFHCISDHFVSSWFQTVGSPRKCESAEKIGGELSEV